MRVKLKTTVLAIAALLLAAFAALACSGEVPMSCQAYGWSQRVFVGTIKKIEAREGEEVVTFDVTESFKGASVGKADVVFTQSNCRNAFKVGESYLVYDDGRNMWTTRTIPLMYAAGDLASIRSRKPDSPRFDIFVYVEGADLGQFVGSTAIVWSGNEKIETVPWQSSGFKWTTEKPGSYRITFDFPSPTLTLNRRYSDKFEKAAELEINSTFRPDDCDVHVYYLGDR